MLSNYYSVVVAVVVRRHTDPNDRVQGTTPGGMLLEGLNIVSAQQFRSSRLGYDDP